MGQVALRDRPAEGVCRRHLVTWILGLHGEGEAAQREQAVAPLCRRWCPAGPVEDRGGADLRLPSCLGEAGVKRQQAFLDAKPEAERSMEGHVPCHVSAQHGVCSGHGWTTRRSIGRSTLA